MDQVRKDGVTEMTNGQTTSMLHQLADLFHHTLNELEILCWVDELRTADKATAFAAMRRIRQTDEKFPTIARFLEVLKVTKVSTDANELVILFQDGTQMLFADYVAQQKKANAYWTRHSITPKEKQSNINHLHHLKMEQSF